MGEPVWTRAAVVRLPERGGGHAFEGSFHLTADGANQLRLTVRVLPEDRRVGEYGRSMIQDGTDGVREAGLPEPQEVRFTTTNWAAALLHWAGRERNDGRAGIAPIDLPVWVDAATGRVVEVHAATLAQELAPLREEGVWLWKRSSSLMSDVRAAAAAPGILARFGGSVLKEWRAAIEDVVADARSSRPPGDRPAGEVEGVSYETWIQVKALLGRPEEVHPSHVDLFTHFRGIPWGRWAAIDASWSAHAPPGWVRYDVARFRPVGARWEIGH